jgi:hypothetical protein
MSSLPSLATPDDIAARLGRTLNPTEAARVDGLLSDGSAIIRSYCNRDFLYYDSDTKTMVADGGIMMLTTWRPVVSIDSVIALSGTPGIADIPVTWYNWDGVEKLTVFNPSYSGIINLPEYWYEETFWWGGSFKITGSHGFVEVPDDVVAVLASAVTSELATPTMSATLMSESVGAYSYSMRRTSGAGLNAALIDAGMKTVLMPYHKSYGTVKIRL